MKNQFEILLTKVSESKKVFEEDSFYTNALFKSSDNTFKKFNKDSQKSLNILSTLYEEAFILKMI